MKDQKNKTIAYFLGEFPKPSNTFINNEIYCLLERGYFVEIYCMKLFDLNIVGDIVAHSGFKGACSFQELSSFKTIIKGHYYCLQKFFISYLKLWYGVFRGDLHWKNFIKFISLIPTINSKKPNLIYCHFLETQSHIALLLSNLLQIPYILKTHGTDIFMRKISRWEINIVKNSFKTLTVDRVSGQKLKSLSNCSDTKISTHRCGIDLKNFSTETKKNLLIKYILFVGRLVEHKGVYTLLDACHILLNKGLVFSLIFIGDGPEKIKLQNQAKKLNLTEHTHFMGSLPPDEVKKWYQQSTLLALPSRCEGAPMVIMEAMAMGTPIVSTKIAGIPDMVEDGISGFLVDHDDEISLADRIGRLLIDDNLILSMGAAAKNKSNEFDIKKQTNEVIKLIEEAMEQ